MVMVLLKDELVWFPHFVLDMTLKKALQTVVVGKFSYAVHRLLNAAPGFLSNVSETFSLKPFRFQQIVYFLDFRKQNCESFDFP